MRFILYTNNFVFALTVLGYTVIIPGLMMQAVLGGIQVLFFIILLFNYQKFSKRIKEHLIMYGTMTAIFLMFFFIGESFIRSLTQIGYAILCVIIPLCIAGYFTYILVELEKRVL